jgi:tripartite-type tricarboxylate transporter receptor subunit TctC
MIWNRFQMGRRNLGTFASKQAAEHPAKTVREFIAYAKSNPGEINMASSGIGTSRSRCATAPTP